jgi:transcriptional regulator of acetoin/glycerol metabolism
VGTCISTGQALTVHLDDHFDATHIPLTCTTSPVFDPQGRLSAVLDISALSSPQNQGQPAPGAAVGEDVRQH